MLEGDRGLLFDIFGQHVVGSLKPSDLVPKVTYRAQNDLDQPLNVPCGMEEWFLPYFILPLGVFCSFFQFFICVSWGILLFCFLQLLIGLWLSGGISPEIAGSLLTLLLVLLKLLVMVVILNDGLGSAAPPHPSWRSSAPVGGVGCSGVVGGRGVPADAPVSAFVGSSS